jgi:Tol biopolymer transport system component
MLWVVNIDSTSPMPVTETEGNFAWSPNSAQIAFTSEKNGFEYTYISMGGKTMGMEFTAYTHSLYVIDLVTKSVQRMTYLRNVVTSQIMWLR